MAISLSNLATSTACQYKYEDYKFTCDEPTIYTGSNLCVFHDINYLKGDNYDIHKEEVAKRFKDKLLDYSSRGKPFKFIGYCLPDISFQNEQFTEALYFSHSTFYGEADFNSAKFYGKADFNSAKFSRGASFF